MRNFVTGFLLIFGGIFGGFGSIILLLLGISKLAVFLLPGHPDAQFGLYLLLSITLVVSLACAPAVGAEFYKWRNK